MRILVTLMVILVGLAATTYLVGLWPAGPAPIPTVLATPSPLAPTAMLPSATPSKVAPTVLPRSPVPARTVSPARGEVRFDLAVTEVGGTGLTRTVSARLANVGNADAHGVWLKLEASSAGAGIKLGGQDHLRDDVGTLKAASSVTRRVILALSPLDGLKVARNGTTIVLTVYSDEGTQTFSHEYRP